MEIRSNRTFVFTACPAVVWAALSDPHHFPGWWPWLRAFDGDSLAPGAVWHCEIKPPLPWTLDFDLVIGEVDPRRRVTATVRGAIQGAATIELSPVGVTTMRDSEPAGGRCRLTLVSTLSPGRRLLAAAAVVARPVVVAGHDWVIDSAARQFADCALHAEVLGAGNDGAAA